MIFIQIILVAVLLFIMARLIALRHKSQTQAWKKMGLLLLTIAAIICILFPSITNWLARLVGVGRGADLLLYALTMAFIFTQLNAYIKAKDQTRQTVLLVRRLAILEAQLQQTFRKK